MGAVRALVVSNMRPDATHPERGQFVRDQVAQLGRLGGVDVQLHELAPGPRALMGGAVELRRRYGGERLDVVHAHFGLTAWAALTVPAKVRALTVHGTDVSHPRTRQLTRLIARRMDILAAVSAPLAEQLAGLTRNGPPVQTLPCGVDLERFHPIPRGQARAKLGLAPDRPFVLFPADPDRPEKRHDRAIALAGAAHVELHALGGIPPEEVPYWINACNAVLVPSEREGFGLAVLEALACDVPVLATPVGVHAEALDGVDGALCAPFELATWLAVLNRHIHDSDPRIAGRAHAGPFSAASMAERVATAWRTALRDAG